MSRSTRDRVVVVEVPAEALLVAEPGDAHDHRVGVRAVGEEAQARRLAAQLVLGVVQVGEVLDLRDRQQPADAETEAEAEDRLLVEQGVEHARRAEALRRPRVRPYTPPLRPTSSPNTSSLRAGRQRVGERGVDALRERQRAGVLGQPLPCAASGPRGGAGRRSRSCRPARRERRHHLLGASVSVGVSASSSASASTRVGDVGVALGEPGRVDPRASASSGSRSRSARDLRRGAVAGLDVAAGVAEEPHRAQVQQGRLRLRRRPCRPPRGRRAARLVRVVAVGVT